MTHKLILNTGCLIVFAAMGGCGAKTEPTGSTAVNDLPPDASPQVTATETVAEPQENVAAAPTQADITVDPEVAASMKEISMLEAKLAANPDQFDWTIHNNLRHHYWTIGDDHKSHEQCDIIFAHSLMDDYTLECMGAREPDRDKAVSNLLSQTENFPEFRNIAAACCIKAAELQGNTAQAKELLQKVAAMEGDDLAPYRELASQKLADISADIKPVR